VDFIKEISGNRFFCISNYEFKIYSLNQKNEYSLILLIDHLNGIQIINEINENTFIICTNKGPENYWETGYQLFIEKFEYGSFQNEDYESKLTFPFKYQSIFKYNSWRGEHYFSDSLILKKKYLIIGFDKCNIIIFNIKIGKQIKRYY
jgi:hypothetical protein